MAAVVFGVIIALSLFVTFMASRGRDVLQIEEYLVRGRSFPRGDLRGERDDEVRVLARPDS